MRRVSESSSRLPVTFSSAIGLARARTHSKHRRAGRRICGGSGTSRRALSQDYSNEAGKPQHRSQGPSNFASSPPPKLNNSSPPSLTRHRLHPSNMGDEPRKRSRFDQAEPDPPRRSKFDRRSRSPSHRDSEGATRSRSPVAKSVEGSTKRDAAAAAAEAAARINAQLSQKKAPQHVDVPPIRAVWPCPVLSW